jgi:hypothetical protein
MFTFVILTVKVSIRTYHDVGLQCAAMFMVAILLWLTVSLPFVTASQNEVYGNCKAGDSQLTVPVTEEESSIPLNSAAEEKASSTNSQIEEFLHHNHTVYSFSTVIEKDYNSRHSGIYVAFHGELIVPPPDIV